MLKAFLATIFLLSIIAIHAQDTIRLRDIGKHTTIVTDRPPQAVYFQLGGSGPIISANYDRRFFNKVNGLGFAAGIGYWSESNFGANTSIFSVPLSINYLFGRRNDFLELAAGATYISASADLFDSNDSESGFFYHVNMGYRHQPATGGFFFRGGYSPLFYKGEYQTSFYLGFGYNF
jgi:hypothetical protein